MEPTTSPAIHILARGAAPDGQPTVTYQHQPTGETWVVAGVCNQCGLCALGDLTPDRYRWHGPVGTPGAVEDLTLTRDGRADDPVLPHFFPAMAEAQAREQAPGGCTLTLLAHDPRGMV